MIVVEETLKSLKRLRRSFPFYSKTLPETVESDGAGQGWNLVSGGNSPAH